MSANKGPLICETTTDGTIIEVGGEERCVVVDLGGNFHPAVCGIPVEKLKEIGSKWMYQPVRVTISIHEPTEPLLKP